MAPYRVKINDDLKTYTISNYDTNEIYSNNCEEPYKFVSELENNKYKIDLEEVKKDIEKLKKRQFKLHYLIFELLTEEQHKVLFEKITKYKIFD